MLTDVGDMLNTARKRGEVMAVPSVPVGEFDKGEGRQRLLEPEEAARLYLAAEEDWLRRFVMLAAGTGASAEALLELTRFQVDVGARLVRLNPPGRKQTKKVRPTVRLADRLIPIVEGADEARVVG